MPAARYWRIVGIETYAGGDLELSELHLYDTSGRIDVSAVLTCSHAPLAGSLSNLQDNDTATTCRFAAAQVRSPGFWLQWDFGSSVDLFGVRLGAAGSPGVFLSQMTMVGLASSGLWEVFLSGGRWPYPGNNLLGAVPSDPTLGAPTTFNPADKASNIILSGDLTAWSSPGGSNAQGVVRTLAKAASGKWYVEFAVTDSDANFGIAAAGHDLKVELGSSSLSLGFVVSYVYAGAANLPPYPTFKTDGITGMALDLDSSPRTVRFIRGASIAGPYNIPWAGDVYVAGGVPDSYDAQLSTLNAGQAAFVNGVPAGHLPGFGDLIGGLQFAPLPPPTTSRAVDVAASAPVPAHSTPLASRLQLARDIEHGGPGTIYGTTKTKGTPNLPTKARVVLQHQRSKLPVRETWSDPTTGYFEFRGIDASQQFLTLAEDEAGNFQSVAANRLTPEVLP